MPSLWHAALVLRCCVATSQSCVIVASGRAYVYIVRGMSDVPCGSCIQHISGGVKEGTGIWAHSWLGMCPIPQHPCRVHGMGGDPRSLTGHAVPHWRRLGWSCSDVGELSQRRWGNRPTIPQHACHICGMCAVASRLLSWVHHCGSADRSTHGTSFISLFFTRFTFYGFFFLILVSFTFLGSEDKIQMVRIDPYCSALKHIEG
jgi:hypothetical protein